MTKKFNSKLYQGKDRIYRPVAGATRVAKVWVWNYRQAEYLAPPQGKCFLARKYEVVGGKRKRVSEYFKTLQEARDWQAGAKESEAEEAQEPSGLTFAELVQEWERRTFPKLAESTRVAYEKLIRLYMGSLAHLTINELNAKRIDQWLDELKNPKGAAMQSKRRMSFDHELCLLGSILKYYGEYHDDAAFRFPIKERHWEAVKLNRPKLAKPKDLTEAEFLKFREALKTLKYGRLFAAMATVQFFQALRISEAAGLFWEDFIMNLEQPELSRVKVVRYVCWPRKRGLPSFIKAGFKNSEANSGIKEQPMFPETFEALAEIHDGQEAGLVFKTDDSHFTYRQIQYAYDKAFRLAGLPYSATHVMRHGGCRNVYNRTGDLSIAQQHLGNSDIKTVQVYAVREAAALTGVALESWKEKKAGRNWSQPKKAG